MVFDVTNRESFTNLKRVKKIEKFELIIKWFMEIDNYAQPDVEKILVGNKIDLVQARAVKTAEAVDFAQRFAFTSIFHSIFQVWELVM